MIAYKFLTTDGTSVFTGFSWPLPQGGPGAWVEANVEPCRSGIHACRPEHLPLWAGQVLYEADAERGDRVLGQAPVVRADRRAATARR